MCGRYTQAYTWSEIHEQLSLFGAPRNLEPRYNVAPTQMANVVRIEDGKRRLVDLKWGLVPHWAKDEEIGRKTINARRETVATKNSYRDSFKSRRCLVPASGFYEWKGKTGSKQPYYIKAADDRVLAFAGLWARWPGGDEPLETFTIITCPPNEAVKPYHARMPVILPAECHDAWLSAEAGTEVLVPYTGDLIVYPVGKAVGSPHAQGLELVEPIEL